MFNDMFARIHEMIPDNLEIKTICIGSSGIMGKDSKHFFHDLLFKYSGCDNILIETDAYIALYGHLGNESGISITSGTGSICCGKISDGNFQRVGGWGHLFSDEGSAYAISIDALDAVFKYIDGRLSHSRLFDDIFLTSGVNTADDLIAYIYEKAMDKTKLAAFSIFVNRAAERGDEIALMILRKAAYDLFSLCNVVAKKLDFNNNSSFLVVLNGSVLTQCKYVRDEFISMFKQAFPLCCITSKTHDAVLGAVLLALSQVDN